MSGEYSMLGLRRAVGVHLSKLIGSNRQAPLHWKQRALLERPPHPLPFAPIRGEMRESRQKLDLRRPYRILSLDGGGVRGVVTTIILERIMKEHPQFLNDVDMIAGTSAGGILALLLASDYSPKQCTDIYIWTAQHIFGHDPYRYINPFKARYCDVEKEEIFKYYFGDRMMADLKKKCSVVSFKLDGESSSTHRFFGKEGWRPAIFSNMPRAGDIQPDKSLYVWDAAMRTSAAPTLFPAYKGYIDGGIVANNPSVIAVAKALAHRSAVSQNVTVLSIGAGTYPRHSNLSINNNSNLLLDGDSITIDLVMHYLMDREGLYHRFDPQLPKEVALDDVTAMKDLADFAWSLDISETLKFVEGQFSHDDLSSYDDTMATNSLDHASNYHEAWEDYAYAYENQNSGLTNAYYF